MRGRQTARGAVARVALVAGALGLLAPAEALAYGGPGSVVSGIGALLATVAAVVAAIFGFLWYPLKRLYRKIRGGRRGGAGAAAPTDRLESPEDGDPTGEDGDPTGEDDEPPAERAGPA